MSTASEDRPQALVRLVTKDPTPSGYALIGLAVVLAALPIWLGFQYGWEYLSVALVSACVPVILALGGAWLLLAEPERARSPVMGRILLLAVGGSVGFILTIVGLLLTYKWWSDYLVTWLQVGEGKELWRLLVVLVLTLGGLVLMFASLQLGRTEERQNATLRRLLYGYNAVLTGLLLLAVLAVANVLVYLKMPQNVDFTASNIYSLSPRTISLVQGLDQPVQIYAVLSQGDLLLKEVEGLLDNVTAHTEKVTWKELSPDLSPHEFEQLYNRYPSIERDGILIVYGPRDKEEHRFIQRDDLFTIDERAPRNDDKPGFKFKGEDVLAAELDSLMVGKDKPIVYFTQGNGELDLNDRGARQLGQGAGVLMDLLEKRNFVVKPLNLGAAEQQVPDDATAVIIAGPTLTFNELALKALRDYVKPEDGDRQPGKLLVLSGPPQAANAERKTGLEALLTEMKVQLGDDRILGYPTQLSGGINIQVVPSPEQVDSNPIARAFRGTAFSMIDVRSVKPVPSAGPGGSPYVVSPLFQAREAQGILIQTDLKERWGAFLDDFMSLPGEQRIARLSPTPVPVAVTVSDADPNDPHMFMSGPKPGTPRLVVFGNSIMASNLVLSQSGGGGPNLDLIAGSLDWLRGRKTSFGLDPKQREFYTLPSDPPIGMMVWMPSLLMLVGIIGLGAGVWVVRRR